MKAIVVELAVNVYKQAGLIDTPVLAEGHYVPERLLRLGRGKSHEMRIIVS